MEENRSPLLEVRSLSVSYRRFSLHPLSFTMEGREYRNFPDNRDMDPDVFYGKLRSGLLGTTSAVSPGIFQAAMTPILEAGKDAVDKVGEELTDGRDGGDHE